MNKQDSAEMFEADRSVVAAALDALERLTDDRAWMDEEHRASMNALRAAIRAATEGGE